MSRKRPDVIIYDCDGVLFDSRASNEAFYNHILKRFGLPPLREDQLDYVHMSTAEEAIDFLFADSPYREEAQVYRKNLDYRRFVPLMRLEPNVKEVIQRLRRAGCRTAIATNRGYSMPWVIHDHGLEGLFDLVVTSLDVAKPKPHPECLFRILERFGVPPSKALYVGDSDVDSEVARRAQVPFVAYRNPRLSAKIHIQDHVELLDHLNLDHEKVPSDGSHPARIEEGP